MAKKREKNRFKNKSKFYLLIVLMVVIIGSIMLILNRKRAETIIPKVKFHTEKTEIFINDKIQIGYTIYNLNADDKLIWTTSNDSVASVDSNGVIIGKSFGDVIITLTINDISSTSVKIRVKSYDVSLILETSIKPSNGEWYNKEFELEIQVLNIEKLSYCITNAESCTPNLEYKDKIKIKNGISSIYIEATDKNNRYLAHRETYKVDSKPPKCTISRIGKLTDLTTTIAVSCEPKLTKIVKYEWYRNDEKVFITDNNEISITEIYAEGNVKYKVLVYDEAMNISSYKLKK